MPAERREFQARFPPGFEERGLISRTAAGNEVYESSKSSGARPKELACEESVSVVGFSVRRKSFRLFGCKKVAARDKYTCLIL